jgi:hypothetical protein
VKRYLLFLVLSLSLSAPRAFADGSLFSAFGIGDFFYFPNSQAGGMGYAGVALLNPFYINTANPAMLTGISEMRFTGTLNYSGFSASSATGRSSFQAGANLGGAGIAFPIWKTVFSSGIYTYSRLNYSQRQSGAVRIPEVNTGFSDSTAYTFNYRGSGGLNVVPLSLGYTVYQSRNRGAIRLGLSYNFIFGSFERFREQIYTPPIGNAVNPSNASATFTERASGTNITFGLGYSKLKFLSQRDFFTLGYTFTTATTLDGQRETVSRSGVQSDSLVGTNGSIGLPSTMSFGVTYSGNEHYLVAADVVMQNWSGYRYFDESVANQTRNAMRVNVGTEYLASLDRRGGFFARTAYRFGAYYNQSYLNLSAGGLNEVGVTAGFGFPISGADFSRVDVNFEFARRGFSQAFVQENIFRMTFSINAGERWFQKRRIE